MCRHTLIDFITKKIVFLACCGAAFVATAQSATTDTVRHARVEKSIWGVQAGFVGVWGYYELRLADQLTLRTDLGALLPLFPSMPRLEGERSTPVVFSPTITVGARWYYNLAKRMRRSKDIAGNSGNFLSLRVGYIYGLLGNNDYAIADPNFPAMPVLFSWGIRRNIGHHVNYEIGVEAGVLLTAPFTSPDVYPYYYPHLRIGYRF